MVFIAALILIAKLAFFAYILFAKERLFTYYKNCYYASMFFLAYAVISSIFGPVEYISLIVWGLLTYFNRKMYLEMKN